MSKPDTSGSVPELWRWENEAALSNWLAGQLALRGFRTAREVRYVCKGEIIILDILTRSPDRLSLPFKVIAIEAKYLPSLGDVVDGTQQIMRYWKLLSKTGRLGSAKIDGVSTECPKPDAILLATPESIFNRNFSPFAPTMDDRELMVHERHLWKHGPLSVLKRGHRPFEIGFECNYIKDNGDWYSLGEVNPPPEVKHEKWGVQ